MNDVAIAETLDMIPLNLSFSSFSLPLTSLKKTIKDHRRAIIDFPFLFEEPSQFAASITPSFAFFFPMLADELEVHISWP